MNKALFLVIAGLLLVSCKPSIEGQHSIQSILNETKSYDDVVNETELNETVEANETEPEPEEDLTYRPYSKCKNAVILYDGCKWTDETETEFTLKVVSASRISVPGIWLNIIPISGEAKQEKRAGEILSEGRKSYEVDYEDLVDELGPIKRIEAYPIEVIDDLEYSCENQKIYTIPDMYCKDSAPLRINEDGTVNETS